MSNPLHQIFRFILKLVLGLSAAVLAVGLLLVALTVFALSLIKSLITGRKPAPIMAFARFQEFSQQGMWPGSHSRQGSAKAASGQVVDVEVREIPDNRRQP
ncbi:hypothetical protein [Polaromonas sp.]|uniref:hypothetical protein n=1 Tax=Polaromonas sp. TaxID=1869339 RepID=UPI001A20789E|nr:hypothetical protein [Burkholderiales bacterium]